MVLSPEPGFKGITADIVDQPDIHIAAVLDDLLIAGNTPGQEGIGVRGSLLGIGYDEFQQFLVGDAEVLDQVRYHPVLTPGIAPGYRVPGVFLGLNPGLHLLAAKIPAEGSIEHHSVFLQQSLYQSGGVLLRGQERCQVGIGALSQQPEPLGPAGTPSEKLLIRPVPDILLIDVRLDNLCQFFPGDAEVPEKLIHTGPQLGSHPLFIGLCSHIVDECAVEVSPFLQDIAIVVPALEAGQGSVRLPGQGSGRDQSRKGAEQRCKRLHNLPFFRWF